MRRALFICFVVSCLGFPARPNANAGEDAKDPLQGVWIARSLESDGKAAPAEAVRRMQFTFQGKKLFIKGNFADDRVEECTFKVDVTQSPKHLDITPPESQLRIPGIYDVKDDQLSVCLRHASSSDGRPTEFASKVDSKLILIVFQRQHE